MLFLRDEDVVDSTGPWIMSPTTHLTLRYSLQAISDELKPLRQFGVSEAVSSAAWIPGDPNKLLTGMGMKNVRLYDIRTGESSASTSGGGTANISISTKAVYGIAPDPFHPHRFASYQEDGIVRIWDLRKPTDPVLSLHVTGALGSAGAAGAGKLQPIDVISWSPRVMGLLATHQRDAMSVRLWEMQEGTTRVSTSTTIIPPHHSSLQGGASSGGQGVGPGSFHPSIPGASGHEGNSPGEGKFGFAGFFGGGAGTGGTKERGFEPHTDVPVLWRTRQTKPSVRLISSFAWIPTGTSSGAGRLVLAARDGTVDAVSIKEAARLAWAPTGTLLVHGDQRNTQIYGPIEAGPGGLGERDGDITAEFRTPQHAGHPMYGSRRTSHGLVGLEERLEGLERSGRGFNRPRANGEKGRVNMELRGDISVVMRQRAHEGYGMTAEDNISIIKDTSLTEVWAWLAQEEKLAEVGRVQLRGVAFNHQGIQNVLLGLRGKTGVQFGALGIV
jgi:hypothetical protein